MTGHGRHREQRVSPERCLPQTRCRPSHFGLLRGPAAAGAPHTLTGRAHGDPFPLPMLGSCGAAAPSRKFGVGRAAVSRRADEVLSALNSLDAPTAKLRSFAPSLPPTQSQCSVIDRVLRRIGRLGPPVQMDGPTALHALLKSTDVYTSAPCAVKAYYPEKFGVLSSGIEARPLRPRLPPVGQ